MSINHLKLIFSRDNLHENQTTPIKGLLHPGSPQPQHTFN